MNDNSLQSLEISWTYSKLQRADGFTKVLDTAAFVISAASCSARASDTHVLTEHKRIGPLLVVTWEPAPLGYYFEPGHMMTGEYRGVSYLAIYREANAVNASGKRAICM